MLTGVALYVFIPKFLNPPITAHISKSHCYLPSHIVFPDTELFRRLLSSQVIEIHAAKHLRPDGLDPV